MLYSTYVPQQADIENNITEKFTQKYDKTNLELVELRKIITKFQEDTEKQFNKYDGYICRSC